MYELVYYDVSFPSSDIVVRDENDKPTLVRIYPDGEVRIWEDIRLDLYFERCIGDVERLLRIPRMEFETFDEVIDFLRRKIEEKFGFEINLRR